MTQFDKAIVSRPGEERVAPAPFGGQVVVHATAEETGGALGMWETFTPPGKGPHDHTHTREIEVFRVIRGAYRFRCGDDEFDAHPGAVVVMPPNIPHSFRNIGDEPCQMLVTVTPGGFEQGGSGRRVTASRDPVGRETECWPSAPNHRARPRLYRSCGFDGPL